MAKVQLNIRVSDLTRSQLNDLTAWWGTSETETVSIIIDRFHREAVQQKKEQTVNDYRNMTKDQLLAAAGVTHPTNNTYLYIDRDGNLQATEKYNRFSYPIDEATPIGYTRNM